MYKDVTVVIPCLNEEVSIGKVIEDVRKYLPGAQIVVVDNDSTDTTYSIALELADIVLVEKRKGKGFAANLGFDHANSNVVIIVDGDATYSISDAPQIAEFIRTGIDMVVAKRIHSQSHAYRKGHLLGNKFFAQLQLSLIHI